MKVDKTPLFLSFALGVLAPLHASAQVAPQTPTITIIDNTGINDPHGSVTGFDPSTVVTQTTPEGIGVVGDYHVLAEWYSANPPPASSAIAGEFNMLDPNGVTISDTLSFAMFGRIPTAGDPNNVSILLNFQSASLDGLSPASLLGGSWAGEVLTLTNIGNTGLSIDVASSVPGPLPGIGLAGAAFLLAAGTLDKLLASASRRGV